jgi:hypothetical protein
MFQLLLPTPSIKQRFQRLETIYLGLWDLGLSGGQRRSFLRCPGRWTDNPVSFWQHRLVEPHKNTPLIHAMKGDPAVKASPVGLQKLQYNVT